MFLSWDTNTTPATSYLIYDVTVAAGAPDLDRHVNVLFDFDRNGRWSGAAAGAEWAIVNQVVNVAPGNTETLISPSFAWGDAAEVPICLWVRVALTRSPIDANLFGAPGWDGSGAFAFGEIEDFELFLRECPPAPPPVADPPPEPPPCPPEPGTPPPPPPPLDPPDPPPPGPRLGWNGQVLKYRALVVQGPDHDRQTLVAEAGATMKTLLEAQGYATELLSGALATKTQIEAAIDGIVDEIVCEDRVLIYFIAHGRKNTPGGLMRIGPGNAGLYSGADLQQALDKIKPCKDEPCDEPKKSCDVTVIIESCYSGQWKDGLAKDGRRIFTSSSSTEPSWGGSDGSGGEYSDRYAQCALDEDADVQPAPGGDGFLNPAEIHDWAQGRLVPPPGKPQTPQKDDRPCRCRCPTPAWDLVLAHDAGVFFGPSIWTRDGVPIGETFGDGVVPDPGVPLMDHAELPDEPNDWHWSVQFLWQGVPVELLVWVFNLDAAEEIGIDVICVTEPSIPGPFTLEVDPLSDTYQVSDGLGRPLWQDTWSQYPNNLPSFIETTGSARRKIVENLAVTEIPTLSPGWLALLALLILAAGVRIVARRR